MDLDTIYSKLGEMGKDVKEVDGKVGKLLTWKEVHDKGHETITRDVSEVRSVLFDNPGLKSKVERLCNNMKTTLTWRVFWLYVLKAVVVAAVLGAAGVILKAFKVL